MTEDLTRIVLFTLIGLNIAQFLLWSRQVQKLVDKLMSKNYSEYVQGEALKKPQPSRPDVVDQVQALKDDLEEKHILEQLNRAIIN